MTPEQRDKAKAAVGAAPDGMWLEGFKRNILEYLDTALAALEAAEADEKTRCKCRFGPDNREVKICEWHKLVVQELIDEKKKYEEGLEADLLDEKRARAGWQNSAVVRGASADKLAGALFREAALADRLAEAIRKQTHFVGAGDQKALDEALAAYDEARKVKP